MDTRSKLTYELQRLSKRKKEQKARLEKPLLTQAVQRKATYHQKRMMEHVRTCGFSSHPAIMALDPQDAHQFMRLSHQEKTHMLQVAEAESVKRQEHLKAAIEHKRPRFSTNLGSSTVPQKTRTTTKASSNTSFSHEAEHSSRRKTRHRSSSKHAFTSLSHEQKGIVSTADVARQLHRSLQNEQAKKQGSKYRSKQFLIKHLPPLIKQRSASEPSFEERETAKPLRGLIGCMLFNPVMILALFILIILFVILMGVLYIASGIANVIAHPFRTLFAVGASVASFLTPTDYPYIDYHLLQMHTDLVYEIHDERSHTELYDAIEIYLNENESDVLITEDLIKQTLGMYDFLFFAYLSEHSTLDFSKLSSPISEVDWQSKEAYPYLLEIGNLVIGNKKNVEEATQFFEKMCAYEITKRIDADKTVKVIRLLFVKQEEYMDTLTMLGKKNLHYFLQTDEFIRTPFTNEFIESLYALYENDTSMTPEKLRFLKQVLSYGGSLASQVLYEADGVYSASSFMHTLLTDYLPINEDNNEKTDSYFPSLKKLEETLQEEASLLPITTKPTPGDLIFYQNEHKQISYAGVFVGNNQVVYASEQKGKILSTTYHTDNLYAIYRLDFTVINEEIPEEQAKDAKQTKEKRQIR